MLTLTDVWRPAPAAPRAAGPRARSLSLAFDLALTLVGSALIALSARVAIPLPFSPVPVTGQTFAVLLVGAALGRWRGAAAVIAYLAEGAAGLPVFAGPNVGPAVLVGPTGGYLFGFIPGAWLCGLLAECGWDRRAGTTILSMILGNVAIFAVALPWLARYVGASNVWAMGFWPFVPGDVAKIGLAAAALPLAWKWLGRGAGQ
ncbi:MAG TPA: biotin transporter BioY [Candidatus Dormibacteraeota bacterium]|nr:biotin transporter BioY [Candidatus Dormibacteraeota bacterium]